MNTVHHKIFRKKHIIKLNKNKIKSNKIRQNFRKIKFSKIEIFENKVFVENNILNAKLIVYTLIYVYD